MLSSLIYNLSVSSTPRVPFTRHPLFYPVRLVSLAFSACVLTWFILSLTSVRARYGKRGVYLATNVVPQPFLSYLLILRISVESTVHASSSLSRTNGIRF